MLQPGVVLWPHVFAARGVYAVNTLLCSMHLGWKVSKSQASYKWLHVLHLHLTLKYCMMKDGAESSLAVCHAACGQYALLHLLHRFPATIGAAERLM